MLLAPMLLTPIVVIGGQAGNAHHPGLQAFGPRCSALPMAHGVDAAANSEVFPRRRLGAGVGRHGHRRFGGHDKVDTLLVKPPQGGSTQKSLIKQ
jgi:hypothetical protein